MTDLIIFGAGGMARETRGLVNDINNRKPEYSFLGFAVDDEYYHEEMVVDGQPVYSRKWLVDHRKEVVCACAIGYPKDRRTAMQSLKEDGIRFVTLIHPTAVVAEPELVGDGCIIGAFCSTSYGVHVGEGVFLNGYMVTVGHDCIVEDFVTCFPKSQISGGCFLGEAALIGSLAYIHEHKKVGAEAVVAPGSIVMRNVKPGMHVMGNPAKSIEL